MSERRFFCAHVGELGYKTPKDAQDWIDLNQPEDKKDWRIVECIIDPVTDKLIQSQHKRDLEAAFERGKLAAQQDFLQRIRSVFGL